MTLGAYHPYTIHTMHNLGLAYQAAGKPEKALAMFQQAAAGLEKLDFTHAGAGQIVWEPVRLPGTDGSSSIGRMPGGGSGWRRSKKRDGADSPLMPRNWRS